MNSYESNVFIKCAKPFAEYSVNCDGVVKSPLNRYLKVAKRRGGKYPTVVLLDKIGRPTYMPVHRLVANAFLDNPDKLTGVRHLDGDYANYSAANLEWFNEAEEQEDLTAPKKEQVLRLIQLGYNRGQMAETLNISRDMIRKYINVYGLENEPINYKGIDLTNNKLKAREDEDMAAKYFEETPQELRDFILCITRRGFSSYLDNKQLDIESYRNDLIRYGFPTEIPDLQKVVRMHQRKGTIDEYLSGVGNIKRIPLMLDEVRKPIRGLPGFFVTNFGRVINHTDFTREIEHKPKSVGSGRRRVLEVKHDGGTFSKSLNRVVAEAFLPNPYDYSHLRVIDNSPSNCRADNLQWISDLEYHNDKLKSNPRRSVAN